MVRELFILHRRVCTFPWSFPSIAPLCLTFSLYHRSCDAVAGYHGSNVLSSTGLRGFVLLDLTRNGGFPHGMPFQWGYDCTSRNDFEPCGTDDLEPNCEQRDDDNPCRCESCDAVSFGAFDGKSLTACMTGIPLGGIRPS